MSRPISKIELHPDAMERFERAVKVVAKAPPQHRVSKKSVKKAKKKSGHRRTSGGSNG